MTIATDPPLTFRKGTPADTATLHPLINAAFASDSTTQIWLTPERIEVFPLAFLESKANSPDTVCLIASLPADGAPNGSYSTDGQRIVGCVYVRHDPSERRAWFGTLAIDPTLHAKGLGKRLLEHVERFAVEEWGVTRMEMDVVSSRVNLMEWYEKAGYVRLGTEKPFPYRECEVGTYRQGLTLVDFGKDLGG